MYELDHDKESEEIKAFNEKNNLVWFYSGGGYEHYQLNDSVCKWLINLYDDEESTDLPTSQNDVCVNGLWLEYVVEAYYLSIGKEVKWDKCDSLEDYIKSLKIDNVFCDGGNVSTKEMKLIDMLPIIEKVNKKIKKFLDKENK